MANVPVSTQVSIPVNPASIKLSGHRFGDQLGVWVSVGGNVVVGSVEVRHVAALIEW